MKKTSLYILLLALLFTSCKKYLDVNENPNSPTKPPINGLLGQVNPQRKTGFQGEIVHLIAARHGAGRHAGATGQQTPEE